MDILTAIDDAEKVNEGKRRTVFCKAVLAPLLRLAVVVAGAQCCAVARKTPWGFNANRGHMYLGSIVGYFAIGVLIPQASF